MTDFFINLADAKDPNDSQGRSYREVNRTREHAIPIGWLVEMDNGCRVYAVDHHRDCDQTPLYTLAMDEFPYVSGGQIATGTSHGWPEEGLTPIRPGPRLWAKIEDDMADSRREVLTQEDYLKLYMPKWFGDA